MLKKKLKKTDLDHLRVEQIGRLYPVRLGRFGDRESAVSFLKRLTPHLPRAIVLKVPIKEENILAVYGQTSSVPPKTEQRQPGPDTLSTDRPAVEESSPLIEQTGKTAPEQKMKKPQQPGKERGTGTEVPEASNKSIVSGIVLESTVMPSNFPCMGSKGSLYRLIVRIEEAEDVAGYENFLWDKRGQSMSFFTNESQPAELLSRRIKATVAYKGDRACRLYWIEEIEAGP